MAEVFAAEIAPMGAPMGAPIAGDALREGRASAQTMQMDLLVAMGATPVTAEGSKDSAKHASQLAHFAPLEVAASVESAWS